MKTGYAIVEILRAFKAWRLSARLYLALVLLVLVGVGIFCQQLERIPPVERKTQNDNLLRYDSNSPFASLDPTRIGESGSINVFPLLYSFLFVPDAGGELAPDLARSWTYDPQSRTWTIHIRNDVRFHDRQPATARDVRYSIETFLNNLRPSVGNCVERISVVTDTVLRIVLKADDPDFLQKIWDIEIVRRPDAATIDYYNHPIGSGPFRFKSRDGDREIRLIANEDYFGGRPSLDGVAFHYEPDKEKTWSRLLSGETDIGQEMSPKNYEMMARYEKEYYFDAYVLHFYTILLYNVTRPLFSDPNVRRALAHAIDRDYMIKHVLKRYGVVAAGPMGADSPYHDPAVRPVPYDPERALRLLRRAGWTYDKKKRGMYKNGKCFEFSIAVYAEDQVEKAVARFIQLCLNDVGIRTRVQTVPFTELLKRLRARMEGLDSALTEYIGAYGKPEYLQEIWSHPPSGPARAGCFEHPKVSYLLRKAIEEKDLSRKKRLFHEAEALIVSLQPGTFLFQKQALDVMSKRFRLSAGFSLTHEGISRLRHASLDRNRSGFDKSDGLP